MGCGRRLIHEWIPLERTEVPSGTAVFDWEIPNEWNIRDAYIADNKAIASSIFGAHNLHVVSYSVPVRRTMTREELEAHLYSLPDHPDWIPYRTSYYREHWGFCLRHRDREKLRAGPFEVVIDTTLAPGSLTYAECVVPGITEAEAHDLYAYLPSFVGQRQFDGHRSLGGTGPRLARRATTSDVAIHLRPRHDWFPRMAISQRTAAGASPGGSHRWPAWGTRAR